MNTILAILLAPFIVLMAAKTIAYFVEAAAMAVVGVSKFVRWCLTGQELEINL